MNREIVAPGSLLIFVEYCAMLSAVLPITVGGSPLFRGVNFSPPNERKGVVDVVTWQELIQFGLFIVALIALVIQANDKKK